MGHKKRYCPNRDKPKHKAQKRVQPGATSQVADVPSSQPTPNTLFVSEDHFRASMVSHLQNVARLAIAVNPLDVKLGTWVEVYGIPISGKWNLGRVFSLRRLNGIPFEWHVMWSTGSEHQRCVPLNSVPVRVALPRYCTYCGAPGHPCRVCPLLLAWTQQ